MTHINDADLDTRTLYAERNPLQHIPIIDISPFVSDGPITARTKVAEDLRRACIDVGFFYLAGHGIPSGELDEAIAWGHLFLSCRLK